MLLNNIRKSFLNYFQKNNHKIVNSSSLVPVNNLDLLFTNAGMVQFKNQFTGKELVYHPRIVTSQKCIRVGGKHNDLKNVGFTSRHHTFFEMLGNFSFGNYFKEEAIIYAWEYLTKELQLNKNKLYFTVYNEDIETFNLWKKVTNFCGNKIIKIQTNNNYWSIGNTGACGPCSEIFYDHGNQYFGDLPGRIGENGNRYTEIWNLVFMQYKKLKCGKLIKIPKPSIDTGMGLERISAVMQGVNSNYNVNLYKKLLSTTIEFFGNKYTVASYKIISDHIRASCFLITEGILPSNEDKGYVLRKIIRRALSCINLYNNTSFLSQISMIFINEMANSHYDLINAKDLIESTLNIEEKRFKKTLNNGMQYLKKEIMHLVKNKTLSGVKTFKLYDTYGLPVTLIINILKKHNLHFDYKLFNYAMKKQKMKSQGLRSNKEIKILSIWQYIFRKFSKTQFIRSKNYNIKGIIQVIIYNGKLVTSVKKHVKALIITDKTIFYAESGGQIGDTGFINNNKVYDTRLFFEKIHVHFIYTKEKINVGDRVIFTINHLLRLHIESNHSATHLLHFALRSNLGKYVVQKGSLVNHKKLRFDFSYNSKLTQSELLYIEKIINFAICKNKRILTKISNISNIKKNKAVALFKKKYYDKIRIITIGNAIELCGGTHVKYSGDIGLFIIISEQSVSVGIRRIEALTNSKALNYLKNKANKVEDIARYLKCKESSIITSIINICNKLNVLEKFNKQYINALLLLDLQALYFYRNKIISLKLKKQNIDLKKIYFSLKKNSNSIIILINRDQINKKTSFLIGVSQDISDKHNACLLIKKCLSTFKAKGGGNNYFAQGSCRISNIENLILLIIKKFLIIVECLIYGAVKKI